YASRMITRHAAAQISHAIASAIIENSSALRPRCIQSARSLPDNTFITVVGLGPVSTIRAVGANSANSRISFAREDISGLPFANRTPVHPESGPPENHTGNRTILNSMVETIVSRYKSFYQMELVISST